MAIGNLGAAPGAQPAAGPTGAPIWLDTGPAAGSAPVGQAGNPAPYGGPTYFNSSFESIMAAVSRGEISLNQLYATSGLSGLNNGPAGSNLSAGNPTLLQAISQGVPQNAANGIGVVSGPGVGAGYNPAVVGGGTVISGTGGLGAAVSTGSGNSSTNFGGSQIADPKQLVSAPAVALASPAQYGGN
jgi:hypothetical protein